MHRRARVGVAVVASLVLVAGTLGVSAGSASAGSNAHLAPITGGSGSPAGLTTNFDLAQVGYEQVELSLTGTANAYTPAAPLGSDGHWAVAPSSTAPFTTRLVVYRPIKPQRFNGTV